MLKGWAAEVDVAAGRSLGRGFVVVVVAGVTGSARRLDELEKFREDERIALRLDARNKQRRQIMIAGVQVRRRCSGWSARQCSGSRTLASPLRMPVTCKYPAAFLTSRLNRN